MIWKADFFLKSILNNVLIVSNDVSNLQLLDVSAFTAYSAEILLRSKQIGLI